MKLDPQTLTLLSDLGFIAGGRGMLPLAQKIYEGLMIARPEHESPYIGLAMAMMFSQQPKQAAELLRASALAINPESELARSFLGLALKLDGDVQGAREQLEAVAESGSDQAAVELAKNVLGELVN